MIKEPLQIGTLSFYVLRDKKTGRCYIEDFLESLDKHHKKDFVKIVRYFQKFSEKGELPRNSEKFKHVKDKIYSIKSYQVRIFGFYYSKSEFILTNGYRKKTQRIDPKEFNKAKVIREIFYGGRK